MLVARTVSADVPAPPLPAAGAEASGALRGDADVLLRGPIHEAFATQIDTDATASLVVPKQPPEPISEIPPSVRPQGNNVSWLPGYYAWDDGREDYIWVSGGWRDVPPGRRWFPGYWHKVEGGWRWHRGAWIDARSEAVGYLPPPRKSLEQGPSSPAPSANHLYVPGSWTPYDGKYQWRPGFWTAGRPGWCWIPDHYVYTPKGVIYVSGYWDYPFDRRGTLFAPIALSAEAAARADFRYTPSVVVDSAKIFLHLFVRPGYHHYYFGDFYGDAYVQLGIHPWTEFRDARRGFDPLLSYHVWDYSRRGVDLVERLTGWHRYFLAHPGRRPPHRLLDVDAFLARHEAVEQVQKAVLGRPLQDLLASADEAARFVNVSQADLGALIGTVEALGGLADLRRQVETGAIAGDVLPGSVEGVVGAAEETLRALPLPEITEPLHRAAPGLPAVEEVLPGELPALPLVNPPALPPLEPVLPVDPPSLPLPLPLP